MTASLRVVVVDDHHLFRAGVIELLRSVPEFAVEGEGESGADAIALAHELHPDVVVLDIEMPGPDVRTTIRTIREQSPCTQIVVLTMHDDPALVRDLIGAGATCYLLKSAGRQELIAAVGVAGRPGNVVMISVSREGFNAFTQRQTQDRNILSSRELEVLKLIAQAKRNHAVAQTLAISDGTVKRHLTNIYAKLGAVSRMDAVRIATGLGILPDRSLARTPDHAPTASHPPHRPVQ